MLPPDGRFTVLLILPDPDAVFPVAPPAPTLVYVHVSEAGNVSATVEPGALLGPAFEATIVYVTEPPGVAVVTPSVLVTARSAEPLTVVVAVPILLPEAGSVVALPAVALFVMVAPAAPGLTLTTMVKTAACPAGTVPLVKRTL